jgi:hypothetical protein
MPLTLGKDDLKRIQFGLAGFVFMAAAGAALVFFGNRMVDVAKKDNAAAQAKRSEIQGRLARAREEALEVKKKIERFNALSRRGILGLEQRLDWIELLRGIKNSRKLIDVQYEIAPQQGLDAAILPGSSAGFDFFSSTMQAKIKLLHEEDLLNFIDDLRASAGAWVRVRRCNVERLPKSAADGGGIPPQLFADCTIDWITIRERKGT